MSAADVAGMTYTRIVLALVMLTSPITSQPVDATGPPALSHLAPADRLSPPDQTDIRSPITVVGDDAQRQRVDNATAMFATFEMSLPDLNIRFWADSTNCDGHDGLFRPSNQPWTIEICSELASVVPHELSHAWERATLTNTDRQTYMKIRGFDVWQDLTIDRADQAIENVALVIQQTISHGGPTGRPNIDTPFDLLTNLTTNQTPTHPT